MMNTISAKIKAFYARHPVTSTLLLINTVMLFVILFMGGFTWQNLIRLGGLVPLLISENQEYYRLLTPMFLHGSIFHFLANSYFLVYFGGFVEKLLGSRRYAFIYFVSGLGSSLLVWWLGDPITVTIGASGSLFGILGALLILTFIRTHWFTHAGMRQIRYLAIINLIFTFLFPNISIYGHLGGFISGIILIIIATPDVPHFYHRYQSQYWPPRDDSIIDNDDDFPIS